MQTQKIIEQLGYSSKEAKVYLVALSLGDCHVSDISKKANLPRTSTQLILDKLRKDGLINFYIMCRYKYWVAEKPEHLLDKVKKQENLLVEVLPRLSLIRKKSRNQKQKKIFVESIGMFKIFAESISEPVLITNEQVKIQYVNNSWENEFGYLLGEVKDQNPNILKSGKTPDNLYKNMWKKLSEGKMFQTDQIVDQKRDGMFLKSLTTIFPVKHNDDLFYIQILDILNE